MKNKLPSFITGCMLKGLLDDFIFLAQMHRAMPHKDVRKELDRLYGVYKKEIDTYYNELYKGGKDERVKGFTEPFGHKQVSDS